MKVLKPPFGPAQSATARREPGQRRRLPHTASRPALDAAVSTRSIVESGEAERAARIRGLKEQIKSGTYRPNLEIVAERLMVDLGVGLG